MWRPSSATPWVKNALDGCGRNTNNNLEIVTVSRKAGIFGLCRSLWICLLYASMHASRDKPRHLLSVVYCQAWCTSGLCCPADVPKTTLVQFCRACNRVRFWSREHGRLSADGVGMWGVEKYAWSDLLSERQCLNQRKPCPVRGYKNESKRARNSVSDDLGKRQRCFVPWTCWIEDCVRICVVKSTEVDNKRLETVNRQRVIFALSLQVWIFGWTWVSRSGSWNLLHPFPHLVVKGVLLPQLHLVCKMWINHMFFSLQCRFTSRLKDFKQSHLSSNKVTCVSWIASCVCCFALCAVETDAPAFRTPFSRCGWMFPTGSHTLPQKLSAVRCFSQLLNNQSCFGVRCDAGGVLCSFAYRNARRDLFIAHGVAAVNTRVSTSDLQSARPNVMTRAKQDKQTGTTTTTFSIDLWWHTSPPPPPQLVFGPCSFRNTRPNNRSHTSA